MARGHFRALHRSYISSGTDPSKPNIVTNINLEEIADTLLKANQPTSNKQLT